MVNYEFFFGGDEICSAGKYSRVLHAKSIRKGCNKGLKEGRSEALTWKSFSEDTENVGRYHE